MGISGMPRKWQPPKTYGQALCRRCSKEFTRRKPWQIYCGPRCREAVFANKKLAEKADPVKLRRFLQQVKE